MAKDCIHNKLYQHQQETTNKEVAKSLCTRTQWQWLCEDHTVAGLLEKPYSELVNLAIETAYKDGKDSLELVDTSGRCYVIDFKKLTELMKFNRDDSVCVVRKDVVKGRVHFICQTFVTVPPV